MTTMYKERTFQSAYTIIMHFVLLIVVVATCIMNSTEVQTPQRKLDEKCLCLPYVFGSVPACAIKSAHMFQELSYSLRGLCLSLSSLITLPQTVRLFYVSLRSQAPQQQYTVLSLVID